MPRLPRKRSKSGIYHIIMRGINRQTIFEDNEDCYRFVYILKRYRLISGFHLYVYCLMGNHVHIVLKEGKEPLEFILRRICSSYVYWYNKKYQRIGYLFQDRFASEVIESDEYFLTAIRYIFQNPVKVGLSSTVKDYKWNNYNEFNSASNNEDINFVLDLVDVNRERAVISFIDYINMPNEYICLDINEKYFIADAEALKIVKEVFQVDTIADFQKLDRKIRNEHIKELKNNHNLSIRQIERLTGINRGIVERA